MIFAELSFALEPGATLILRGANGSGKSSLLRLLAGFLEPAFGVVRWVGASIHQDPAHRTRLHWVGHANALKTALTVRENLTFAASLMGAAEDRLAPALAAFDLAALADVPVQYLSAGQRRRLALARMVAAQRPLWLMDEPDVGLDAANRARLEGVLAEHRAGGGIAVIATHGEMAASGAQVLELGA